MIQVLVYILLSLATVCGLAFYVGSFMDFKGRDR